MFFSLVSMLRADDQGGYSGIPLVLVTGLPVVDVGITPTIRVAWLQGAWINDLAGALAEDPRIYCLSGYAWC
jgi:hypothetical protein